MPYIPINDVAKYGVIKDAKPYELPPNAWSDCNNVRFFNGSVSVARGHSSLTTPSVAPYYLQPGYQLGSAFWIYAGLAKVYAFVGALSADITSASGGDYTGGVTDQWNGGMINGIPVLNNGKDNPQAWTTPDLAHDLVDLPNWPASTIAKVIRPFKQFLVALDVSKSGTRYPRLVKWSHSTASGVPSSWDHTDATKDAGENTLAEGTATLIDCCPLGDVNIIYTETETWAMRFVGGVAKFAFVRLFPSSGILAQGCAARFKRMHAVLTQDDVVVHDGSQVESIIEGRLRNWLFDSINSAQFYTSLVVPNYIDREIWVCFSTGGTALDTALVWHWEQKTWSIRQLPDVRGIGIVEQTPASTSADLWDSATGTWATETATWGETLRSAISQTLLFASPSKTGIYLLDDTTTFAGTAFEGYVERTGQSACEQAQNGMVVTDPNSVKLWRAIHPRFGDGYGQTVRIKLGMQMEPTDPVTWADEQSFVIGTDFKLDFNLSGRFLALRVTGAPGWKLEGYDLDVVRLGIF